MSYMPMRANPDEQHESLDSWKEIAAYLGRDVSTVQRWEHSRRLPVRRIQGGKRGAVYALKSELDDWKYHASAGDDTTQSAAFPPGTFSSATSVLPPGTPSNMASRRITLFWVVAAVLGVLALGAVIYLGSSKQSFDTRLRFVPLAGLPGEEIDPAFSPDGGSVAFSYRPDGGSTFNLYVKSVGVGEPLRLTDTPGNERYPQWSPDSSQLAFLRATMSAMSVWVVGALGGGERQIAAINWPNGIGDTTLAWAGAGDLVVANRGRETDPPSLYLLHLATGSMTRLTYPPPDTFGDVNPVPSPDGRLLAFIRQSPSMVRDIWVMASTGGQPRRITSDQRDISGLGWTEDGKHLLFISDRGEPEPALWSAPVTGSRPTLLTVLPPHSRMLAVSSRKKRIAYSRFVVRSSIWRYTLSTTGVSRPERLITSSGIQATPQYSPDGSAIAFMSDRSGFMEIWVARSDGSKPRQLTWLNGTGGGPRWSPDGTRISFDMRVQGNHGIYVVGADGGPVVTLVADRFENGGASWSRDGAWVYFGSNRTGMHQVWKIAAAGGPPVQVTRDGGGIAFESPDAAVLYYAKGRYQPGLWRKTLPQGEEVPVLPDYAWARSGAWQLTRRGISFLEAEARLPQLKLLPYAGGGVKVLATLDETAYPRGVSGVVTAWYPMTVSSDDKNVLITQLDERRSNIMIAEQSR